MARRRKKQLIPTVWVDWTPGLLALFRLLPDGSAPVGRARICGSLRRRTISGRFLTPEGRVTRAFVRIEAAGEAWDVVESGFSQTFVLLGAGS